MTAARPKTKELCRSVGLADKLNQAGSLLAACIAPGSPLTVRMHALRERLVGERLHLAVLGQFKRGKSTFLNALLGAPLLPTGVVPLTAVATFIAWGREPMVRVLFRDQRAPEEFVEPDSDGVRNRLFRFVAEEANPNNRLGVARVELLYPAPILSDGTVLIDTPGVGSTLKHNTDAARQVLAECDAALFVLSADPPITETEVDYLRGVKARVSRIFFILNKVDHLGAEEQTSVIDFLRKVLSEESLIDSSASIFCVSARQGLAGKERKDAEAIKQSGVVDLEEHLVRYLATEKVKSLEDALTSEATELLGQAAAELALRVQALRMPLEELQSKSEAFELALRSIEEQRRPIRDLLAGDQRRLRDKLESTIELLRAAASSDLAATIDDSLSSTAPSLWQGVVRRALAAAIERFFDDAREDVVRAFSSDTTAALSSYEDRIDSLVEQVQRTASDLFHVKFVRPGAREAFKLGEDPYWLTDRISDSLLPDVSRVIDPVLPLRVRQARIRARILQQADLVIIRNAENLRWAVLRGLDETFRSAGARLEERLDDAITATRGVISQAFVRRQDRSFAVRSEMERLTSAERSVKDFLRTLQDYPVASGVPSSAMGNAP